MHKIRSMYELLFFPYKHIYDLGGNGDGFSSYLSIFISLLH